MRPSIVPNSPPIHPSPGPSPRRYEQLRAFHAACYHPSSALFFSYGDLSPLPHMAHLDEHCLRRFSFSEVSAQLHSTSLADCGGGGGSGAGESRTVVQERCNPDPMQGDPASQGKLALSGVLHDSHDTFRTLLMHMTSTLLLSGPSAPLYQARCVHACTCVGSRLPHV